MGSKITCIYINYDSHEATLFSAGQYYCCHNVCARILRHLAFGDAHLSERTLHDRTRRASNPTVISAQVWCG